MSEENLIIKIGGDVGEALEGIHKVGESAEELNGHFSTLTKIAAASFAAFSAEIALSVVKFGEADQVSKRLSQTLQDQGIFTQDLKDQYKEYAESVSALTGIEGKEIEAGQATIQRYLGQKQVTEELTQAIADYAVAKGVSLVDAAEKLGKALDGNAGRLKLEGLEVDKSMTEQERYGKVLDFVTLQYGGQAEAANQGLGGLKGLSTAFSDLQEQIGERFAPVISSLIAAFTHVFQTIKENPVFVELAAAFLAAGAAITGVVAFLGVLIPAISAVSAAVLALGISFNIAFVGIPLLIGAIVAGTVLLATNWESASARIITVVRALGSFIAETFSGIGKILSGAFHLDKTSIVQGLEEIREAFKQNYSAAVAEIPKAEEAMQEVQDKKKDEFAKRSAAQKTLTDNQKIEQEKKYLDDLAALRLTYARKDEFQRTEAENKKLEALKNSIKTERDAEFDEEARKLKVKIDANNKLLAEQARYNEVYAALNFLVRSNEIQGAKSATAELVDLQKSKHETLRQIGKAAAVSQIIIKTGESAMNIFAGFSEIPIVGEALGIAGAAAAIAYGAEQVDNVLAANEGGLVTGGIRGRDSVPALLTPGELVVPERNFDQVVGSYNGGNGMNQEAVQYLSEISTKLDKANQPAVQIHGDVIGDDVMVDKMIRKINQAVLYRNAQLLTRPGGVTGG